jgi:hypothetical protein
LTKVVKEFDPAYDYAQDISPDDIKTEDGRPFVFLRGLEKLAKARGITSAMCVHLTPFHDGAQCTYMYSFADGAMYQGSADATTKNCDGNFKLYTTAMAESRAKARALRTAFSISMCSVEEKSSIQIAEDPELGPIQGHQLAVIKSLALANNLDRDGVLAMLELPRKVAKMDELTNGEGLELINKLNKIKAARKPRA